MSASRYEGRLLAGRYRLQTALGQGGMGRVWQGYDELLDRPVAVKEVTLEHRPQSDREALLSRTMSEARLAARLSHPHIATVYDVVEADGRPWIVLQLIPAPTLADVLARRGPLPPAAVARIGLQVLEALQTAHAAGIVHCDVKPANILLDSGHRHAVLTDFGLATRLEQPVGLTEDGRVVGTPAYVAPERARGDRPTSQTDLWSLGVTLYTAVEGRSPFEQDTAVATISAVLTADPPPFERAGALAPLITALLDKDPARRPTIRDARRQLRRVGTSSLDSLAQTGAVVALPPATLPLIPERRPPAEPPAASHRGFGREGHPPAGRMKPAVAGRVSRGQVRHVALVAAMVAGALAAAFWPGEVSGPPPAGRGPATGVPTTPATPATPPPSEGSPSDGALRAQPVAVRQPKADRRRADSPPAPTPVASLPPGQAKKATGVHVPPGLAGSRPGKGNAKGRK